MTVYVVTMYRWGQRENHSYVLGVYNSSEVAENAMQQEEQDRGGKYDGMIDGFELDGGRNEQ